MSRNCADAACATRGRATHSTAALLIAGTAIARTALNHCCRCCILPPFNGSPPQSGAAMMRETRVDYSRRVDEALFLYCKRILTWPLHCWTFGEQLKHVVFPQATPRRHSRHLA